MLVWKERKTDDSDVAFDMTYGVDASSLSWFKSVIPKEVLKNLDCAQRLLPFFEGEHLEQAHTSQPAPISSPRASP